MPETELRKIELSSLADGQTIILMPTEMRPGKNIFLGFDPKNYDHGKSDEDNEAVLYVIEQETLPPDHELCRGGFFNIYFDAPLGEDRRVSTVWRICSLHPRE